MTHFSGSLIFLKIVYMNNVLNKVVSLILASELFLVSSQARLVPVEEKQKSLIEKHKILQIRYKMKDNFKVNG